jgi:DNA-binding transcriptional LysR family regulator
VLDWNDYRYFLAVAKDGSLSAAARSLGVDQSTVGRRLAALQDACGTRLFDHTPNGYVLTPAGEGVRADVVRLEEGFLAVERRLAGADATPEGVVRVATTETFATAFFVERLSGLRERYPRLLVELLTGNQLLDLARREADVAIRLGAPPKQPNLRVRKLGIANFSLYAAPAYLSRRGRPRGRDGGLAGHHVVAYAGGLANAPIGRWLDERARGAEQVMRTDNIDVAYRAVATGLGIGALPCLFGGHGLERVHGDVIGSSPITCVVHEDQARSVKIRAVADYIAQLVERERDLFAGERVSRGGTARL